MENQPDSLAQWYENISNIFQGVPREAIRFYNIETLPRLLYILDHQKESCPHCQSHYKTISGQLANAAGWIKADSSELKPFKEELTKSLKHLSMYHGITPKGLWLSRLTAYGIIAGIIIAVIISFFTKEIELHELIMLFFAAGMIIGWISGRIVEKSLRKKQKLF